MYCSVNDIIQALSESTVIQLSQDDGSTNVPNVEMVTEFIEQESQYIDTYLRPRYAAPLTDDRDKAIIRPIAVQLVCYRLYSRRSFLGRDKLEELRYTPVSDLQRIQKGEMVLPSEIDDRPMESLIVRSNTRQKRFSPNREWM